MLIYTDEMRAVAGNLYIATDDGSEGYKGMVTGLIRELIDTRGKRYDECVAIGPMVMMKFVALATTRIRAENHRVAQRADGRRYGNVRRLPGDGGRQDASSPASTGRNSTVMPSISTRRCAVRGCTDDDRSRGAHGRLAADDCDGGTPRWPVAADSTNKRTLETK